MKLFVKKLGGMRYRLTAILLVFAALAALAGCSGGGDTDVSGDVSVDSESKTYTVSVSTVGGMAFADTDVYVYADDSLSELVNFGKTDENGIAEFSLPQKDGYAIVLPSVKAGYNTEASYSFSGSTAIITLTSSLIKGDITTANLTLGDVMYDCEITDINGEKHTLSDVLAEKKMVLLNFWNTGCTWCWTEFPIMASVYEQYSADLEIFALDPDPYGTDTVLEIQAELAEHDLSLPFKIAKVPYAWASTFAVSGYPVSVVVDRYGVICLLEEGAITSKGAWINIFDHFTSDDYEQKLVNDAKDLVVKTKPAYEMESEETVSAALGCTDLDVKFYASDDEYSWPFLTGEKNGAECVYASNKNIDSSYAILCADVTLKAGQAIGIDYFSSTELGTDILHIIVDDEDVFRISGQTEDWVSVYPCVAEKDGTYKLVLSYIKDDDTDDGEDTVYLRNLRVIDAKDIDTPSYLPKEVASTEDGFEYEYKTVVYNETDGYYHVDTANGPLLLANLTAGISQFNETETVYMLLYNRGELVVDGEDLYTVLQTYAGYASNATLTGFCPVTEELAVCLKALAKVEGFDPDDPDEWLKMCRYYAAYGTNGAQLENPIKGLANFCAYKATLGKNVSTNCIVYDRMIYPRGLWVEFTPAQSGVYRITSVSQSAEGVEGWLFDDSGNELLVYEPDERMFDSDEVSMVYYMEAGKSYYFSIAFWDLYEEGTINYDIEYVAQSTKLFRLASQPYFTYQVDDVSGSMNYTIAGGIDVVLGDDGIWYEDLGKTADGKQRYGGALYVDFTGSNGLFSNPIMSYDNVTGMIDMGGFDFTRTEEDEYILSILRAQGNDKEATINYLKETWDTKYDDYCETYQVEDVLAGRYHGTGKDCTEEIRKYISQVDNSANVERNGCVLATKELTDLLQMLMDKYTFSGVEHSWTKLCYYYDYLGPEIPE